MIFIANHIRLAGYDVQLYSLFQIRVSGYENHRKESFCDEETFT